MSGEELADVRPAGGFRLQVSLVNGHSGKVDVSEELYGPVFEPLRDQALFDQGKFDPEAGTIVWPNGADFSPEFLVESLQAVLRKR